MSHFRSKKLLDSARDLPCVECGDFGTTVACHANSVALGKGTGIKAPDWTAVHFCQRCHSLYDGRDGRLTKEEKGQMWMRGFVKTIARLFELKIVVVK